MQLIWMISFRMCVGSFFTMRLVVKLSSVDSACRQTEPGHKIIFLFMFLDQEGSASCKNPSCNKSPLVDLPLAED